MSQTCPNCGNTLSCSCQSRTASDGRQMCSSCITAYETQLQLAKQQTASGFTWVNGNLINNNTSQ